MPELLFHGAAEEVTGSMHMVRVGDQWVALDCGMYQGRRAQTEEKNRSWPVPPKDIAAVILSHAHIDHSGRLPRLVHDGFEGEIYCTPATRDLCAIMLPDSAHIQEEDIQYVNKKRAKKGLPPVEPMYTYADALGAIKAMNNTPYDHWVQVVPGLLAKFNEAGHMLGSSGVHLEFAKENGHAPSLYFTGDLGRPDKPILRDPAKLPQVDAVICESTYGNRFHEPVDDTKEILTDVVNRTIKRGGKLIIPAFSVGRTQTIVYFLHEQMVAGNIPSFPVYVDSPLSVNATEVFRMHPECYDAEARAFGAVTSDILGGSFITYIKNVEESKALNRRRKPCAIISASGMCEFGRIRHHIKNNIRSAKNTILIPGFQASHTLGRKLAEGAEKVNIFHTPFAVKAEIVQLHGFSGHADQKEILSMVSPMATTARKVFVVHGEPDQQAALAGKFTESGFEEVTIAKPGMRATF